MNRVALTDDGKLCRNDYKSIYRAILETLYEGPKKLVELVSEIRRAYHEFKYIKDMIIIRALHELIQSKMVVSNYRDDY